MSDETNRDRTLTPGDVVRLKESLEEHQGDEDVEYTHGIVCQVVEETTVDGERVPIEVLAYMYNPERERIYERPAGKTSGIPSPVSCAVTNLVRVYTSRGGTVVDVERNATEVDLSDALGLE